MWEGLHASRHGARVAGWGNDLRVRHGRAVSDGARRYHHVTVLPHGSSGGGGSSGSGGGGGGRRRRAGHFRRRLGRPAGDERGRGRDPGGGGVAGRRVHAGKGGVARGHAPASPGVSLVHAGRLVAAVGAAGILHGQGLRLGHRAGGVVAVGWWRGGHRAVQRASLGAPPGVHVVGARAVGVEVMGVAFVTVNAFVNQVGLST